MGYYLDMINGKNNVTSKKTSSKNDNNGIIKNNNNNNNSSDRNLEQIDLITQTSNGLQRVENNEVLAVVRQFGNAEGNVILKGQGTRFTLRILNKSYKINTEHHRVNIRDKNSTDGRYSQDVGIGDDVSLRLKISFVVPESEINIQNLLKNPEVYKSALRDAGEQIMRLTVRDKYDPNNSEDPYIDIEEMRMIKDNNSKAKKVFDIADEIENKYGIKIERVTFSDFDKSEKQKEFELDFSNREKRREQDLKDAENEKKMKELKADAERYANKIKEEHIQNLHEKGEVPGEKLGDMLTAQNLPNGSVAVMGGSSDKKASYAELLAMKQILKDYETEEKTDDLRNSIKK